MHQRAFLGAGWARGGASEVVRRAHPASGAQWNVQVVRGKVNGKCLWNACKALSLGLLLMLLGAAMATIGYYADHLSYAQEVRGNYTIRVKNESRGFHLNNLSYAGPIVMGVGGFIVVAACVMTFEARDSAAKVVPARFKMSTTGPPSGAAAAAAGAVPCVHAAAHNAHSTLRTSGSQTAGLQHVHQHSHYSRNSTERKALTQSFMQFSKGLAIEKTTRHHSLKVPQHISPQLPQVQKQGSINKSPSAPNLARERSSSQEQTSPVLQGSSVDKPSPKSARKGFAGCALLNPGLLHRHALSVDETGASYSQGSMAMDLHTDCPVTLRIRDRRRNPLKRQRRVDEDERANHDDSSRRSSHSCSPRIPSHHLKDSAAGGSVHQLPTHYASSHRRSSNASDCTHRSRSRRRECQHVRGRLERAISSDSRLTGAVPRCRHHHHHHTPTQGSTEKEPAGSISDSDIRHGHHAHTVVHFSDHHRR